MDNAGITKIIAQLEEIRRRPLMWLGKIEVLAGEISATEPFLNGFNSACAGLGYKVSPDIREEVTRELGWNGSATG